MKSAPLIVISPSVQRHGVEFGDHSLSLSHLYASAIFDAGGVPWVIPCLPSPALIREIVRRSDGVMLTGGDDVQPSLYIAKLSPQLQKKVVPADPARDCLELLLIAEVFSQRKPMLGICRGLQLLNVAFGGTLTVDLATQAPDGLDHSRLQEKDKLVHDLHLPPGSMLSRMAGTPRIRVNSSHHQAVERLAGLFRAAGTAPDGVVEAFELTSGNKNLLPYFLAVQFHPERLYREHPLFLELFRSFTAACRIARKESV